MKKILLILILNIILPLFLLVIIPSIFIRTRQGTSYQTESQNFSFISSKPVSFEFTSNLSNLQSLVLDFKNPSVRNNSKIIVDVTGPSTQRSVVFFGANIGDPSSVPLKFDNFNDPPKTKYTVELSTDNTDPNGLYLLVDKNNQTIFRSFYKQSNLKQNLVNNASYQYQQLANRSPVHSLLYFSVIIAINIFVFFL